MASLATFLLLATPTWATPSPNKLLSNFLRERSPSFEWTAWGDSYASGVGTGQYINGRQCLRYEEAYPVFLSDDPDHLIPGSGGKFNNAVCSGSKMSDVLAYQLNHDDRFNEPNLLFSPRPGAGNPAIGTLTVSGDDVDFPGILNNCIVGSFPIPLNEGFPNRTCPDQVAFSWSLISQDGNHTIPNTVLINNISTTIKSILDYGHQNGGPDFRLYVTGYGQFFNDQNHGCDSVTFSRNPDFDSTLGRVVLLTTDLRSEFNAMSRLLNTAIQEAINQHANENVRYIDIDKDLTGHRFCEPGITEPDLKNANNWFWHYPYGRDGPVKPITDYLSQVAQENVGALSWDPEKTLWVDYLQSFWSKVDVKHLESLRPSDNASVQWDFWPDYVGVRARLFHPTLQYHEHIYQTIVEQYLADISSSTPQSTPTPTLPPPAYATGTCHMHVNEFEDGCEDEADNLRAEITIWDANGAQIGYTDRLSTGDFPDINANGPLHMMSKLPKELIVTGEHNNDYVQFALMTNPQLSWTSRTTQDDNANAYCKNGGWDPRDGSYCDRNAAFGETTETNAVRYSTNTNLSYRSR